MNSNHYIAIMAGGRGTRFWPASTEQCPKQFLDILGVGKSLLQITYERAIAIVPKDNILVITNENYTNLVKEHLPTILPSSILSEPSMNNTAPSVAYVALHIKAKNENAVFAILPSDQVILLEMAYFKVLKQAFQFAESSDTLLTLGISPTRPDTGYGYIEVGCDCVGGEDSDDSSIGICRVESFKEKPDLTTAQSYLKSGNYLWNAGMFVWTCRAIITAFEQYSPGILSTLNQESHFFGSDSEQEYINSVYPSTEKISIDYAILEKANNVFTIPADIGWSDIGTWNSLYSFLQKDEDGNVIFAKKSQIIDVHNSLIRIVGDKKVVIKGLDNYIVVVEDAALLIYPKEEEQEIKAVVNNLHN